MTNNEYDKKKRKNVLKVEELIAGVWNKM